MDQWHGGLLHYISKLQKRSARIILHADFNTSLEEIFKEISWLPIVKRLKYKAVFTYKAMNNLTLHYITVLLKPVAETHNRTLRSSVNGAIAVLRSPGGFAEYTYPQY